MTKVKILGLVLLIGLTNVFGQYDLEKLRSNPKSDVYFQGFYWNSPPGGIWWDSLAKMAPRLASAGFSGIWFPSPVKGAAGGFSMGYDPYDHYDFGEFNQKGSRETRFGSRQELLQSIQAFNDVGIDVFADAVMNHMNGGEAYIPVDCKPTPSYRDSNWLLFDYPNGSQRFKKNASDFYPNQLTCNVNPPYHGPDDPLFGFGEWLAHDKPSVRDSLIAWGKYLINTMGFKGFRVDAVKGIDPVFMAQWVQGIPGSNYAVAEYYGGINDIIYWFNQTQNVNGGDVAMFDFPLRFTLKDMCNNTTGSFDMTFLDGAGLINAGMSGFDVSTWVENHDVDRIGWDGTIANGHDPILTDKMLAYAYILFSEGRPSVFFKDYVDYGFGGKIDSLIWIRQKFIGGGTTKRGGLNAYYIRQDGNQDQTSLARDIYVARRNGFGAQPGGYLLINDNPNQWIDVWVDTELPIGAWYKDYTGRDANKQVVGPGPGGNKNRVKLWAPPRSYTIYVGDTTQSINHPPVVLPVPDLTAYTNSMLEYKVNAYDVNGPALSYSLTGNPSWLSITPAGVLKGTPGSSSIGTSTVILKVQDPAAASAIDTFKITVLSNLPPSVQAIPDTVIRATRRIEYQVMASDPDNDTVRYSFSSSPSFLNIGTLNGMIAGTPAVEDTGLYIVKVLVTDGKGAFDSTAFQLRVRENTDSIIATYGKPFIDGNINVGTGDWLSQWLIAADSDTDSYWAPVDTINNELLALYVTWDADSLYTGIDYILNDTYNTMMLYLDAGISGGVTNFNSNSGYLGDYAKNFRFRPEDAVDYFLAAYHTTQPVFFKSEMNNSTNYSDKVHARRGAAARGAEFAIAWDDIYGLGAGKVIPNVKLKFVTVVAGGFNYGAGDAMPDNPDVDGNAGPDSLINLASVTPDLNGDGIPDPTIFISTDVKDNSINIPEVYMLSQNYPNPFNPATTIQYALPESGEVALIVYDMLGRVIGQLVNGYRNAGVYTALFESNGFASGIYFYELRVNGQRIVKKMNLLK